jgi:hypothetical protein
MFFRLISFTSCSKKDYLVFGNKALPKSEELKSFAFVDDGLSETKKVWTDSQKAIFSELNRRNYFYDDINPEVLVFITHFDKGAELLTGNSFQTPSGKN